MTEKQFIKICDFPAHGEDCQCSQLNDISMRIAQDIWNSCAKHLGPTCGLSSDQVFMVTAVAMTAFIESMAADGRDNQANPITIVDVLNVIFDVYKKNQLFLKEHETK